MLVAAFFHFFIFSIPFNAIFLALAVIITYPFASALMAHRKEKCFISERHLYPLDLRRATHYFVCEDHTNPERDAYNVYHKLGSTSIVYSLSKTRLQWWKSLFLEKWKLSDGTGFELSEIQYVCMGFKSGLIHFLLPRPEEQTTGTVRITPRTVYPKMESPPTARCHSPFATDTSVGSLPGRSAAAISMDTSEFDDDMNERNYDYQMEHSESLGTQGIESSLMGNALISEKQLGAPVVFDQLSAVEKNHWRDLHNVLATISGELRESKFRLTRDDSCHMTWDTVGNLEVTHTNVSPVVCERVGLLSKVLPQRMVGYRVIFNEEKIDALSAIATSFLQYKSQKV